MKTVDADEAQMHFAQLLDEAAEGETIIITREGQLIAQLMPAEEDELPDAAKAIEEWRRYQEKHNIRLNGLSIGEMIEEGRM